jgi:hypothetical protein
LFVKPLKSGATENGLAVVLSWLIMSNGQLIAAKTDNNEYITKADLDKAVEIILNHLKTLFENLRAEIRNAGRSEPDHQ